LIYYLRNFCCLWQLLQAEISGEAAGGCRSDTRSKERKIEDIGFSAFMDNRTREKKGRKGIEFNERSPYQEV